MDTNRPVPKDGTVASRPNQSSGGQPALEDLLSSLTYESIVKIARNILRSETESGSYSLDPVWEARYHQLMEYRQKFGTSNVSRKNRRFCLLGEWVFAQRSAQHKNLLSDERVARLNELGFKWGQLMAGEELWNFRYKQLIEYKNCNGTCNVPQIYTHNSSLGNWVSTQRVLVSNKVV